MKKTLPILTLLLLFIVLTTACNADRRSEEAQGREVELVGDEPDEAPIAPAQPVVEYNPADTVVTLSGEEVPPYLKEYSQVLVATYLEMEEALLQENAAQVKVKAEQLMNVLLRHEQENMELTPQVKSLFTNATHVLRQSAQSMLQANALLELQSAFSAMAPATYKLAKLAKPSGSSLYYYYCAESFDNRGAYWLSRSKEINNPYAEQDKQACGKTVGTL